MFLTTLSFLITTPGVWEPSLGGFPALSAVPGQFLIKDLALLGISLCTLGEAWNPESRHNRTTARQRLPQMRGGSTMFRPNRTSVIAGIAVVAVIAGLSYTLTGPAVPPASAQPQAPAALVEFTADGKLKQPAGYRKWMYIGTPLTPNDMNDGEAAFPEFHEVYMDPESFAHYEKTGKFRDGTVLIKELSSVGSKEAPSGKGYFQGEFTGLEAAIKDSKRFKDEPGYWAYFSFGHKYPLKAEVAKGAVASCNQCHADNAGKTDWVFSQYYPVLRAAAPKSK
jgi:hypothetical protein